MEIPENNKFGICRLSVVPVRAEPSDKAEISTELLFGELIKIIKPSDDGKWTNIEIIFDGYIGWIDVKQYEPVSDIFGEDYQVNQHPFTTDLVSNIFLHQKSLPLIIGSTIPFYEKGIADLGNERMEYKGNLVFPNGKLSFKTLENFAKQYLGAPYLWGGKSPFGIDCSGFTQVIYKLCGCKILRDASQQAEQGTLVDFQDILPGDLAFFTNAQGRVIHVGIILENLKIIHASGEVRIDRLDATGIFNVSRNVYSHKLNKIRRYISFDPA